MCSGSWRTCRCTAPASAAARGFRLKPTCIGAAWNNFVRSAAQREDKPVEARRLIKPLLTSVGLQRWVPFCIREIRVDHALGRTGRGRCIALRQRCEATVDEGPAAPLVELHTNRIPGIVRL